MNRCADKKGRTGEDDPMNFAVIFAGGVGKRMAGSQIPKQFLEAQGKAIIIHTLEFFQENPLVDKIVISCVSGWLDHMQELVQKYRLDKVVSIVPGGASGQLSIYHGLTEAKKQMKTNEDLVLVHDGVRPLISDELITRNVETAQKFGSCITCVKVIETIVKSCDQSAVDMVYDRDSMLVAKAPQTFRLADILAAHERAMAEGITDFIDSCTLMSHYQYPLHMILGDYKNIKITTPIDYAMFKAILDEEKEENRASNH